MKNMGIVCLVAFILVAIGGINWGLVGVFDFNLVSAIFGDGTMITRAIYILVGVSALYLIFKKVTKKKEL